MCVHSFNRTSVRLKLSQAGPLFQLQCRFNRTSVRLKPAKLYEQSHGRIEGFNRTSVRLKPSKPRRNALTTNGFNRTSVRLKPCPIYGA